MEPKFRSLITELEKADVKDAVHIMSIMLAGPHVMRECEADPEKRKQMADAITRLSMIGMMCVIRKKDLVGILREHGAGSDDTTLEDDLLKLA
jgi:hypothetical protein